MHPPMHRLACVLALTAVSANAATNLTSLVNLFIGTASGANGGSGGNAFPGVHLRHMCERTAHPVENDRRGGTSCHGQSQSKSNLYHAACTYVL